MPPRGFSSINSSSSPSKAATQYSTLRISAHPQQREKIISAQNFDQALKNLKTHLYQERRWLIDWEQARRQQYFKNLSNGDLWRSTEIDYLPYGPLPRKSSGRKEYQCRCEVLFWGIKAVRAGGDLGYHCKGGVSSAGNGTTYIVGQSATIPLQQLSQ